MRYLHATPRRICSLLLSIWLAAPFPEAHGQDWRFGSASGRDGDGGFVLSNTSSTNGQWSVEPNALRFSNPYIASAESHYTEAAATIDLRRLGINPGEDFTLTARVEVSGIWEWNRFGLFAYADAMPDRAYAAHGFHAGLLTVGRGGATHAALARGYGGGADAIVTRSLPDVLADGVYLFTLSASHDEQGLVTLRLAVKEEGANQLFLESRPLSLPQDHLQAGFGGRFRAYASSARQPVIDIHEMRVMPKVKSVSQDLPDPVQFYGTWARDGLEHPYRVTIRRDAHALRPLPTVVYLRNLPIPRLGTDSDEAIVEDLLDEGLIVIEVDCRAIEVDAHDLPYALMDFNHELVQRIADVSNGLIAVEEFYLYWLPEGYRLARNLPFFDIVQQGPHGTLERMVEVYNSHVTRKAGVEPIATASELAGPHGEPLDHNLYIDLIYPSGNVDNPPPVIAHFASICRMPGSVRGARAIYPLTWLSGGYAMALVDHVYNPLARNRYFGYFDGPYTLQTTHAVAASSAAIRFLRAHAEQFNLGDRIGILGHSKSSYSVIRVADAKHPELPEHATFADFPSGTPEAQPWPGYSSHVNAVYASMGLGLRWTQYTTADMAPLLVAVGRHDQFGYWDVTPRQVATAEGLDLHYYALWMGELGHTLPHGMDLTTGVDRTRLVRRFFDQQLLPHGDQALRIVSVVPADGAKEVPLDGSSLFFGVSDDALPTDLHGLDSREPITVRFGRPVDTVNFSEDFLQVIEQASGRVVAGDWSVSLQQTRFQFRPKESLKPATAYRIRIQDGISDLDGNRLAEAREFIFYTAD
jgi:hypothetical protein